MDTPLVSVCTQAYNHAPFIRQCIEGVLMQKTTFPFEFLIHDDASTDETADVIREYEARYPDIIKPIYQTENQWSKGVRIVRTFQFSRAQGKYIAMCEGDDYWTDPLKLQKQVEFLETHPDYSICGGMWQILYEGDAEPVEHNDLVRVMRKFPKGKIITLQDYLDPYCLHFLTICYRKDDYKTEKYRQIKRSKDDTFYAMILDQGKGFVFHDYFGVYRKHRGGIWSGKTSKQQTLSVVECYSELVQVFGNKSKSLRNKYFEFSTNLRFIELKTSQHLFTDYLKIIKFTFSGKIKDIVSFQIWYFLRKSRMHFINYCRERIQFYKNSSK